MSESIDQTSEVPVYLSKEYLNDISSHLSFFFRKNDSGLKRLFSGNFDEKKSRLEYMLQINPDLDPEVIAVPPEVHSHMRAKFDSLFNFLKSHMFKSLFHTASLGISAYVFHNISNETGNDLYRLGQYSFACISGYEFFNFARGLKDYIHLKKCVDVCGFSEPQTEEEKRAANYIHMT